MKLNGAADLTIVRCNTAKFVAIDIKYDEHTITASHDTTVA